MTLGLIIACSPADCIYPGDTIACMEVTGIPGAIGTFTMTVTFIANVTGINPVTQPINLPPEDIVYTLVIEDSAGFVGISEAVVPDILELDILPNPSSEMTQVVFTSPTTQPVHFAMYNLIGEKLLDKEINSSAGINYMDLNVSELKSGIYFISLSSGNNTVTRKLIVGNR